MKTCESCDETLEDEHFEIDKKWKRFGFDVICVFCSIQLWRNREDIRWRRRQTLEGKKKHEEEKERYKDKKKDGERLWREKNKEHINTNVKKMA